MVKNRIGVIYGTGVKEEFFGVSFREKEIETTYGKAFVLIGEDNENKEQSIICIPRHGVNRNIPPHQINHRANFMALKKLDVQLILSISSVGSLKKRIKPESILIPDDYINLSPPLSFFDSEIKHITPGLSEFLREEILKTAKKIKMRIIPEGVYFQTTGPRLETKAEVEMIKNFADVVGMTMASEATLAKELKLEYASICQVDNYANGIIKDEKLNFEEIIKKAEKTRERVMWLLKGVIQELRLKIEK